MGLGGVLCFIRMLENMAVKVCCAIWNGLKQRGVSNVELEREWLVL